MWKSMVLGLCGIVLSVASMAQQKQFYTVEDDPDTERIYFTLYNQEGKCTIKPTYNINPINIYGKTSNTDFKPEFEVKHLKNEKRVYLNLSEKQSGSLSKVISYKMFNAEGKEEQKNWNIYLSRKKPLNLELNYGVGEALVDLSGLSIENLKINTASADIEVMYQPGQMNKIDMDTFAVKVDLGKIKVQRCNLSKAKQVIADVGFGSLYLDFSDKSLIKSTITASVGAGSLVIYVPDVESPIIININNSPLCHVKLSKIFKEIKPNVFVNSTYAADAENLITFNLDVAMGNISFRTK